MTGQHRDDLPFPTRNRTQVARDLIVFQVKLFMDGVKDLMLSPVALVAGLIGIFLSRNPGEPLYRTLRFGKRIEHWIDLFAAGYVGSDSSVDTPPPEKKKNGEEHVESITSSKDFDTLIDKLQTSLMDPQSRERLSEQSKQQLDAIAKKFRGSDK